MKRNSQAIVDAYLTPPDLHESRREKDINYALPLLLAIVLTVLHTLNIYCLIAGITNVLVFLLFHLILSAVSGLIARARFRKGFDCRIMTALTLTSAVTGPFGSAGTVLCILMLFIYRRSSQPFGEWFESIFPTLRTTVPETMHEDIVTGRDESTKPYSVIPFLDVLAIGSETQKAQALSRMMLNFHPSFGPVFKTALHDESNMIRVQAATAAARVEHTFLERLLLILKVRERHPDDDDVLLALAEHYDNYAFSGILDAEREQANRARAMEHYLLYLQHRPDDIDVRVRVGRMLLRDGQDAQAVQWFRQSLERGLNSDAMVSWYLESLYRAGEYMELRQYATTQARIEPTRFRDISPALAEAMALWAGSTYRPEAVA